MIDRLRHRHPVALAAGLYAQLRSRQVLRNIATSYLATIVGLTLNLLLVPFVLHALGAVDYGF